MSKPLGIGVIGCGNISAAYMRLSPLFSGIEMRACADISEVAAQARAEEYNLRAESIEGILAAEDIDIIVNLTIPNAHFEVSKAILQAGKHVLCEKPLASNASEASFLLGLAKRKRLVLMEA